MHTGNEKIRRRYLNVLNSEYYAGLVKNIVDIVPRHRAYINQLKNDGYHIVGYCRKSKTQSNNRAILLQRMVNILRQKRSLVEKVFVSPYSNVKESFYKRDFNDQDIVSELDQVDGNTQDFLTFIKENDKVCMVAIDHAGFTTSMNQFKVFDREQLLNNMNDLKLFNCRPNYRQRSK